MLKGTAREAAAEFFGTFILIAFGVGVVAQTVLSKNAAGSTLSINIAWGIAVMLGIYASAGVSGAHLNPAVTVALAVHRSFPWSKVLPYTIAQVAGAFVGAAVVFATYREALGAFDGGVRMVESATATAGIFSTYPQPFLSIAGGFVDQVVGTMLLMAGIMAVTDQKNVAPPAWLTGPLVGLLVVAIGMAFGFNAGYSINPARDFGPRLFTAAAGFQNNGLTDGPPVFWVPIVAPLLGGVIGGAAYDFGVRRFLPGVK